jgi:transposase-like protein
MFQNAGEKGIPHPDPEDPPRRRGNKQPGHGTFENDRPPIVGTVGRESGEVRMKVVEHTDQPTLEDHVQKTTQKGAVVNTDEWSGYARLKKLERVHKTVSHNPSNPEWARDDDNDGIREVHCNTQEGIWTGVRNFLRPFRGVSKWYLYGYAAVFAWVHNELWASPALLSRLLRCSSPEAT